MEVSSLTVILVTMMLGLIVGFEIGQSVMRRRITEVIERAVESTKKELEQKRRVQEEARDNLTKLANTWKDIYEKSKKEQKENGIKSNADD